MHTDTQHRLCSTQCRNDWNLRHARIMLIITGQYHNLTVDKIIQAGFRVTLTELEPKKPTAKTTEEKPIYCAYCLKPIPRRHELALVHRTCNKSCYQKIQTARILKTKLKNNDYGNMKIHKIKELGYRVKVIQEADSKTNRYCPNCKACCVLSTSGQTAIWDCVYCDYAHKAQDKRIQLQRRIKNF